MIRSQAKKKQAVKSFYLPRTRKRPMVRSGASFATGIPTGDALPDAAPWRDFVGRWLRASGCAVSDAARGEGSGVVTIRFRRRAEVVERVVGTTVFLARDESGALYRLNETGTALWRLLAVPTSRVEAIAAWAEARLA